MQIFDNIQAARRKAAKAVHGEPGTSWGRKRQNGLKREACRTDRTEAGFVSLSEGGGADPAPRTTTPPAPMSDPKPSAKTFRHGVSVSGKPKTWTGCVVSLDDWQRLTEWEKHGSNGRLWCGITKQWEPRKGAGLYNF